jgi:hypothetical protein
MSLRIARRAAIAVIVIASLLGFNASSSLAIGPSNQTISPTYDSVVRVLLDVGLPGGQGFFEGTGSVVANTSRNGQGYLWILTADHVVSATGAFGGTLANGIGIAFGNSPTSSGNSVYYQNAKANPANIFRYGSTGRQDLTVFGINYGAFDAGKDALVVNLVPAANFIPFSDVGFGNEGAVTANGYQAQNRYGTQRYFNENINGLQANFPVAGYIYTAARFPLEKPGDTDVPVGAGAALDADSGSPMFSGGFNGTYFTNSQFAVLAGVQPAPDNGLFAYNSIEFGVALNAATINWIYSSVAVPEPGTIGVVMIMLVATLHRRHRRAF